MKKQLTIICITVMLLIVGFSGCLEEKENDLEKEGAMPDIFAVCFNGIKKFSYNASINQYDIYTSNDLINPSSEDDGPLLSITQSVFAVPVFTQTSLVPLLFLQYSEPIGATTPAPEDGFIFLIANNFHLQLHNQFQQQKHFVPF